MELVVIRHGESHVNLGNWDQLESMDTGLTELGVQQAEALRDWLDKKQQDRLMPYTASTMKRTRETAAYVAEAVGLQPIFDDRLREIGNAFTNGQPIPESDLPRSYIRERRPSPLNEVTTDVDNAESWMHFRIRVGNFVEELCHKYPAHTVYVVAHGGVISAMYDLIFNVGTYKLCDSKSANTGWTRFTYQPNQSFADWILYEHSRIDHLALAGLL